MEFSCSNCDYISNLKSNIKKHIKTKKCEGSDIIEIPSIVKCDLCDKEYKTVPSLNRHRNKCLAEKMEREREKAEREKAEREKVEREKAEREKAEREKEKANKENKNVVVAPWDDPKIPDNFNELIERSSKKTFLAIPEMVELVYFNPNIPENHNICIKNFRSNVAKVYNGKKWKDANQKKLVMYIVKYFETILEDYSYMNDRTYFEEISDIRENMGEDAMYEEMCTKVKLLLYDKRKIVKIKKTIRI